MDDDITTHEVPARASAPIATPTITDTAPAHAVTAPSGPFDFAQSRDTTTHTFVPQSPIDGTPIVGTEFYLFGEDTPEYRRAEDYAQRVLATNQKKKKVGGAGTKYTINVLARAMAGWKGVMWSGEPLAYSVGNAEMLLDAVSWLRDQLSEFLRDREERLGKSDGGTAA
jgi:hypothetical protein